MKKITEKLPLLMREQDTIAASTIAKRRQLENITDNKLGRKENLMSFLDTSFMEL